MKKKLMILAAAMILALGCSMTVCAQPRTMSDGTVFDAEYYAQANPDVVKAFGTSSSMLYQHYVQFGKAEGRAPVSDASSQSAATNAAAEEFDAAFYAQAYPDVVAALGTDPAVLYQHYIQFGKAEGRSGKAGSSIGKASTDTTAIYEALIAMKSKYPQGMPWTNANEYQTWGILGRGCAAFAFILSDAAFGPGPYRVHYDFSNIRVGDIIRLNYDTHSVIVLEVRNNSVIVAEGNYNSMINWGREISFEEINRTGTYVQTRYPE